MVEVSCVSQLVVFSNQADSVGFVSDWIAGAVCPFLFLSAFTLSLPSSLFHSRRLSLLPLKVKRRHRITSTNPLFIRKLLTDPESTHRFCHGSRRGERNLSYSATQNPSISVFRHVHTTLIGLKDRAEPTSTSFTCEDQCIRVCFIFDRGQPACSVARVQPLDPLLFSLDFWIMLMYLLPQ